MKRWLIIGLKLLLVVLLLAGCAYHKVKINVPGCGVSTVKLETSCEKPRDHYPEGVEVLCHDFVMTPNGPVTVDHWVVYHCIKVHIGEQNEKNNSRSGIVLGYRSDWASPGTP